MVRAVKRLGRVGDALLRYERTEPGQVVYLEQEGASAVVKMVDVRINDPLDERAWHHAADPDEDTDDEPELGDPRAAMCSGTVPPGFHRRMGMGDATTHLIPTPFDLSLAVGVRGIQGALASVVLTTTRNYDRASSPEDCHDTQGNRGRSELPADVVPGAAENNHAKNDSHDAQADRKKDHPEQQERCDHAQNAARQSDPGHLRLLSRSLHCPAPLRHRSAASTIHNILAYHRPVPVSILQKGGCTRSRGTKS